VNVAVVFDGTASYDPDGDALAYTWSFGDGATGVGVTPSHAYPAAGSYTATLTVSDGSASASDGAPVTIGTFAEARVFTVKNRFRRIKLGNPGAATLWCAEVEPVGGDFSLNDIILESVVFEYNDSYAPRRNKDLTVADADGNGIPDVEFCFATGDLAALPFPPGTNVLTVRIRGRLATGASFVGDLSIEVVNGTGNLAASVTPNPLNPEAVLSFQTSRTGHVSVRIFDSSGRFIRTVYDSETALGRHDVRLDGRAASGIPLGSGVYFYRIDAAERRVQGRFTILK
jgi:hypothetical protein